MANTDDPEDPALFLHWHPDAKGHSDGARLEVVVVVVGGAGGAIGASGGAIGVSGGVGGSVVVAGGVAVGSGVGSEIVVPPPASEVVDSS